MNDEKNKSGKTNNIKDTLRNMAALYLLYLAYKIISDVVKGKVTDIKPALAISIAVLFAAFGIFIIIDSYKKMKREKKRQLEEEKAEAEAKEAEKNSVDLLQTEDNESDADSSSDETESDAEELGGEISEENTEKSNDE